MVECIEHFKKMSHAKSEAVSCPHQHNLKFTAMGGGQHLVECQTLPLRADDLVGILANDFESALLYDPAQIKRLCLRILIEGEASVRKTSL
jgi:hypothetical protein